MQTSIACDGSITPVLSNLDLHLVINDRNIINYLSQFGDEVTQCEKAAEALKVGVIAIQSASPTLDTQIVQAMFYEVESRLRGQMTDFQSKLTDDFRRYFADRDGVVPQSLDRVFGDNGAIAHTFQNFFDPNEGRVARMMQAHVGPQSTFGKAIDPENKRGVLALIEARVQELVEAKLDEVLRQFSLDEDGSAMCRLNGMLSQFFANLNQSLGIKSAAAAEAERGHIKGMMFEEALYREFAELGKQLGDETELVRGTAGAISRCKRGDFVATLGETSGAPGQKVVVEVKDQPVRLKDAIDELQEAKKNREAACGIFIFARGTEPAEVGDFRRIGEDFYITVDKDELTDGKPLAFLDCAYKIARAMTVAALRKEQCGELNIQLIRDQIDSLTAWSDRIADMATKARTVQNSGRLIEQCANDLKLDLDARVAAVLKLLNQAASTDG
jgi:hypothetical protein